MLAGSDLFFMVQWITDYNTAAAILAHKNFEEVTFKGLVPLIGHVIVTTEGEAHRERRSLEGRLFVTGLLKNYEQVIIPPLIAQVLEPLKQTGKGDLAQISQQVSSSIAARLIGLDGLDKTETAQEAIHYLSALVSGTQSHHPAFPILTRREARNKLRERFIFPAITKRQKLIRDYQAEKLNRESLPFDLITLLLMHGWEIKQIAGEVAFYAVAAVDTTATLIPHLLNEVWRFIALRPQYAAELGKLEFLRLCTAEALRLHPALPTLFRRAAQPVELEGYVFPEGEIAGVYVKKANRDKIVFGDTAELFNPYRVVPPTIRRAGLSFGGGAHLCLGRELATGTTLMGESKPIEDSLELFGEAALLAQALFTLNARPDPLNPVTPPEEFERDVFHRYPIVLTA